MILAGKESRGKEYIRHVTDFEYSGDENPDTASLQHRGFLCVTDKNTQPNNLNYCLVMDIPSCIIIKNFSAALEKT